MGPNYKFRKTATYLVLLRSKAQIVPESLQAVYDGSRHQSLLSASVGILGGSSVPVCFKSCARTDHFGQGDVISKGGPRVSLVSTTSGGANS